MDRRAIKEAVRKHYAGISSHGTCCSSQACCGARVPRVSEVSVYSREDLTQIPQESDLGLGCGNPVGLASLKPGETVLDLGSGAGVDCFLAAKRVGPEGSVIGVDMTPQMIEKARGNAHKGGLGNVEFRLGEIENLPVADNSIDVVISNCVINLCPEKQRVLAECFRVLKPGGRLVVSDTILTRELPESLRVSLEAYVGCISGAVSKKEYLKALEAAGFAGVKVLSEQPFPKECSTRDLLDTGGRWEKEETDLVGSVASISLFAEKPGRSC